MIIASVERQFFLYLLAFCLATRIIWDTRLISRVNWMLISTSNCSCWSNIISFMNWKKWSFQFSLSCSPTTLNSLKVSLLLFYFWEDLINWKYILPLWHAFKNIYNNSVIKCLSHIKVYLHCSCLASQNIPKVIWSNLCSWNTLIISIILLKIEHLGFWNWKGNLEFLHSRDLQGKFLSHPIQYMVFFVPSTYFSNLDNLLMCRSVNFNS